MKIAMYPYVPHKEEDKRESGSISKRGYYRDDEFDEREENWRHRQAKPNFNEQKYDSTNRRDVFPFGDGYGHNY